MSSKLYLKLFSLDLERTNHYKMKHHIFVILAIFLISCQQPSTEVAYQDRSYTFGTQKTMSDTTPKVTGIGGIFFRAKDPKATKAWYSEHLGIDSGDYGATFESRNADRPDEINTLAWNAFDENTDYFDPSQKQFMINYRVQNIEGLVRNLRAAGATIVDTIESYSYGKFVHIMDPEGNKIELWEPVDEPLTEAEADTTK